jgi:DNA-directed RNA polymerase II subunit RPB1
VFDLDQNAVAEHDIEPGDIPTKISTDGISAVHIINTLKIQVGFLSHETADDIAKKESDMLKTHIKGVTDIKQTMIRRAARDIHLENGAIIQKDTEQYKQYSEVMMAADDYIVDTVGSNLLDILGMPNVDPYRTFTNDITETYAIYGIEVARRTIIREIYEVLSGVANIDIRHIELLADAMTCRGFLQKIDRYGARKGESGPWALASFEETTSVLCEASAFGQEDNMNGVSSNVMFGQFVKVGTGAFDIYIDEAMILEHGVPPPKQELNIITPDYSKTTQGCSKDDFQFDFIL